MKNLIYSLICGAFLSTSHLQAEAVYTEEFTNDTASATALSTVGWGAYESATATDRKDYVNSTWPADFGIQSEDHFRIKFVSNLPFFLYSNESLPAMKLNEIGTVSMGISIPQTGNGSNDITIHHAIKVADQWYATTDTHFFNTVSTATFAFAVKDKLASANWKEITLTPGTELSLATTATTTTFTGEETLQSVGAYCTTGGGAVWFSLDTYTIEKPDFLNADFESSTADAGFAFDGSTATATNLNAGTTGGTWSNISTTTASINGTVDITTGKTGMTGNHMVIGISPTINDATHVSTATLNFNEPLVVEGSTLKFDANMLGSGGQWGQVFVDLMNETTVVARFALNVDAGNGRGTISHYSAIGSGFYDNQTLLGTEFEVWSGNNSNAATITLALGATDYAITTTGAAVTEINATALSYVNSASQIDKIVFSAEQSKASFAIDNITITGEVSQVTPAFGLEVVQESNTLSWSVEDEDQVKEYRVINSENGEVIEVITDKSRSYSVALPENVTAELLVIDYDGYTQTFTPAVNIEVNASINLTAGWNLISIPGDNADLSELTNAITGPIWGWNGTSYVAVDTPEACQGLWVYSTDEASIKITADKSFAEISLQSGWNLVGPKEDMYVPESASAIYTWSDTYSQLLNNEMMFKGVGYWIYITNN